MAKSFEVEVTVPEGLSAGDTFTITVEAPKKVTAPRGQLAGIALEDMTDEQLKREIINAGSVLYKATKRGADAEIITKNQARLDAAKAEKAKRHPVVEATEVSDGDIDADDLKYGVVLDNGAHKIIVKGNDLNLIKTIANSVKSC